MLILAYFGLFSLIPFLTVKDSEYVKWHAKQGLVLSGATIAASFLWIIPIVGFINCLVLPAALVLSIMGIVKALAGTRWRIPLIADLSEKF